MLEGDLLKIFKMSKNVETFKKYVLTGTYLKW